MQTDATSTRDKRPLTLLDERCSGILLHPSSLPSPHGIGTVGPEARRFVDLLAAARQRVWQILPLGPTGYGDSPYQCFSAFAGNPMLISLADLRDEGWLPDEDLPPAGRFPADRVDFGAVIPAKRELLRRAHQGFVARAGDSHRRALEEFCRDEAAWLDEFALFMSLKDHFGGRPWFEWPEPLRRREPHALREAADRLPADIAGWKFTQYAFFLQWEELRAYAASRSVRIVGDIPIYVAHDSADVWAHPERFQMNESLEPTRVAGVPPDYFSRTGQLWGNPVYDWPKHEATDFAWWTDRVRANLRLYDALRIDHFRGLAAYWAVPFGNATAERGEWLPAPGAALLAALQRRLGSLPLIAEDLGDITPEVVAMREQFGLPGMKVLQFAFDGGPRNEYLPHHCRPDFVFYTGTHDNDTVAGWYAAARGPQRAAARLYLGGAGPDIPWSFIRGAWSSVARLAIAPLQDVLGLGTEGRMNLPGTTSDNWRWRFRWDQLTDRPLARLLSLTERYSR